MNKGKFKERLKGTLLVSWIKKFFLCYHVTKKLSHLLLTYVFILYIIQNIIPGFLVESILATV
jgi:hypothetical protein